MSSRALLLFTLANSSFSRKLIDNRRGDLDITQLHEVQDGCVDISRFGPLDFDENLVEMCTYKTVNKCVQREKKTCIEVPIHNCQIKSHVNCEHSPVTETIANDIIEIGEFAQQICKPGPTEELSEIKNVPVCEIVTKQQCDSKWDVDEQGVKVWLGDYNCRNVSWEDCSLVEKVVTEEVATWQCAPNDTQPLLYLFPLQQQEEVTVISTKCEPVSEAVCEVKMEARCDTVQWEECQQFILPSCSQMPFKIPHQKYEHLLRCIN